MKKWTIEDSKELYNINGWGTSYFGVNDRGHAYVTPCKDETQIDLRDVMDELALRDVTPPVLLRFPDILDNRIEKTSSCFRKAAQEYDYKGENFIIYPIKVNQMQPVVEEIISHGRKFNLGLEAGSKPELHAVIAVQCQSDSLIICNGYKDQSYIELALLAQKMGKRIFIVVEKLNELDIIARVAKKLDVKPNLGIRIKLASSGSGKWEDSGGDASKFGLTSSELLEALELLDKKNMRECLRLIHFHIGSQITKIRRIQAALREASQFYIQLHKMGYNVDFVDCGGGLGVDYDGTRSPSSESSVNYSIQEYVNDCIYTFVEAANKNGLPHPNIITESGRSLTAHHSVLVIDVLETASLPDAWAIDQLFPIVPIQRLDERPTRSATLQDITCDSDGKITNFVTNRNNSHILPVHALKKNEPYYLGVFLVGAYQEILGDMHNLFGDTTAVHISVRDSHYHIDQVIDGETVAEVLDYVQYNPRKLVRQLEMWVTKSVKEGRITLDEGKEFLSNYRSGLYGYTYLE